MMQGRIALGSYKNISKGGYHVFSKCLGCQNQKTETYLERASVAPTQDGRAELANVNRAMTLLSADHREILVLICAKGMSYGEVSEMLQIPVSTVRSRLSRAREQLQAITDTPTVRQITVPKTSEKSHTPFVSTHIASQALQRRA